MNPVTRIVRLSLALDIAFLLISPASIRAATPLDEVHASPDITIDLGSLVLDDEDVVIDDLAGGLSLVHLGPLPENVGVDAFHRMPGGVVLFSLDTTVSLPGDVLAGPGDVIAFDGSAYVVEFDAEAAGLPREANLDALARHQDGDLLMSFDIAVTLSGTTAEDEDVVRFDGAGFPLYFDASAAGVDAALDLDAAHLVEANGHLLMSFDGSGRIGGLDFDHDDLLEFDPGSATFEIAYEASAAHAGWAGGDLDAAWVLDASSGRVPDGGSVPGVPLRARKYGSEIELTWSPSCLPNDEDYAVYEGALSSFASHLPIAPPYECTTAGATSAVFPPGPGNRYWLVVPQGSQREGSYGTDSHGVERTPSPAACQPQLVGICP